MRIAVCLPVSPVRLVDVMISTGIKDNSYSIKIFQSFTKTKIFFIFSLSPRINSITKTDCKSRCDCGAFYRIQPEIQSRKRSLFVFITKMCISNDKNIITSRQICKVIKHSHYRRSVINIISFMKNIPASITGSHKKGKQNYN